MMLGAVAYIISNRLNERRVSDFKMRTSKEGAEGEVQGYARRNCGKEIIGELANLMFHGHTEVEKNVLGIRVRNNF
jgi:hypothetical protein